MKMDHVLRQNILRIIGMSDSKHKKILYLMEYPIDLPGGGQMSTQTLCEGIYAYGYEDKSAYKFDEVDRSVIFDPVVVCPNLLNKKVSDYPFKVVTYPSDENRELSKWSRISNFLGRINHFRKIIKAEKPDLIHVSMSESLISFGFLRCLGMFSKIPFVYTDRGLCYGYRKHSKICIMQTMKHAARMLTTTQFNKNLWTKENIPCDITVIPNTISSAFDEYDESKRSEMRQKHGLAADDFVIGFAGRISEEKDWPCVKNLVKALSDTGLKYKVALVLSVYEDRDKEIVESIKQGIVDSIGQENLIYMQDLSQKDISDYYYMVDVFVMTSMFESFGKAAVEAMSRKCAVVSTPVGGLPEVIGNDEDLYDKENPKTFANRILQLHDNQELLNNRREYFYNRYKTLYTKEVNVLRHISTYKECLK